MIANTGNFFIATAILAVFYSFLISLVSEKNKIESLKKSSFISFHIGTLSLFLASTVLIVAFLKDHFELEYVFSYSSINEPFIYKLAAFYAGREGSLLMWAMVLALTSSAFLFALKKKENAYRDKILIVLSAVQLFFVGTIYLISSPFKTYSFVPANGTGLNPLLENFYMIVHPPALYLGFIFFTVPFAYALTALYEKRFDGEWIKETRNWIILAWLFLGLGNVLGSYWAYIELGWGGYWAWDPVENSSLIPWLISTGLIHSIIVEKNTGMFRIWNFVLMFLTFISTIVATFLTRSGIVESVHAFAKSSVGNYFLSFIILLSIASFGLLILRLKSVSKNNSIESYTSKESSFWLINLIFAFSGIAVLIGTLMPAFSELFINKKATLEPEYYNKVFSILGLVLLFLFGICPHLKWKSGIKNLLDKSFVGYFITAVIGLLIAIFIGVKTTKTALSYSLALGALFTTLSHVVKGLKKSGEGNGKLLMTIRRQGGMIAHIGIILMCFGITGTAHKIEVEKNFVEGEEYVFDGYKIVNNGFKFFRDNRKEMIFSEFDVFENGKLKTTLRPAKYFYTPNLEKMEPQVTTEMGVLSTFKQDLLLILMGFDVDEGIANVKIIKNPWIVWLWIGSAVLFLGTIVVLIPLLKRKE